LAHSPIDAGNARLDRQAPRIRVGGILQADGYAGFNSLYDQAKHPSTARPGGGLEFQVREIELHERIVAPPDARFRAVPQATQDCTHPGELPTIRA
jgi:hypothetical protein